MAHNEPLARIIKEAWPEDSWSEDLLKDRRRRWPAGLLVPVMAAAEEAKPKTHKGKAADKAAAVVTKARETFGLTQEEWDEYVASLRADSSSLLSSS